MIKSNFELRINTNNETDLLICDYYWIISKEMKYVYYVKDIANRFDIPLLEVTRRVSKNATFIVKCKKCASLINEFKKRSDFQLDEITLPQFNLCKKCFIEYEIQQNHLSQTSPKPSIQNPVKSGFVKIDKEKKHLKMEISLKNHSWYDLNEMELESLVIIAESLNLKEIYNKLFYNIPDITSDLRYVIWKRINKLEAMDLIWVERDENAKILNFYILEELKRILKLKYPELFLQEQPKKTPK
jgi:hypothetical protein